MWLIDAMNVVGSRPDGWWRDRPGALQRLVGEVAEWAAAVPAEAEVFLEGARFVLAEPPRLTVCWATRRGRDAADDEIAARVEREPAPERLTVVTSDRALAGRVRVAGARVEGAQAFRRRLDAA